MGVTMVLVFVVIAFVRSSTAVVTELGLGLVARQGPGLVVVVVAKPVAFVVVVVAGAVAASVVVMLMLLMPQREHTVCNLVPLVAVEWSLRVCC